MARPDDKNYPSGMITADERTIGEKFSDWYERLRSQPVGRGVGASPEQMDAAVLGAAKKVGHSTVGFLIGRWTAGVADMPVSVTGRLYSRDKLRSKIEALGIEITETGAPEAGPSRAMLPGSKSLKDPVWELKDSYGNIKTINPDKITEGTYNRDWGEVYGSLTNTEITPEMQTVYQVGRFLGTLKPTSKIINAVTGKIPARPGLLKTAQHGWAGITANSLGQVEDIVAGKRDSFSFKEAHETGAWFTAFGGVIEGAKASVGAISDAYMVNRFFKSHPEALNVLNKKEMRTLGNYGRSVRSGMAREASLKVYGKKMRPIWEKLDKFRSDIEYKPQMPKLLPEKAGLSTGTAQDKIWEQMSPEQKMAVNVAKPTQVTKPLRAKVDTPEMQFKVKAQQLQVAKGEVEVFEDLLSRAKAKEGPEFLGVGSKIQLKMDSVEGYTKKLGAAKSRADNLLTELAEIQKKAKPTQVTKPLYRVETGRPSDSIFVTEDASYAANFEGVPQIYEGVKFDNPLTVSSAAEASQILLGEDVSVKEKGTPGKVGKTEKAIAAFDSKIAKAAKEKGYDAIIYPDDIQVIDKSKLPKPTKLTYDKKQDAYVSKEGELWLEGIGWDRPIPEEELLGPANIYFRMPLERVQADAADGISLAKEALVRMNPDEALGKDLIDRPTKKQFATIHQLKTKHNLTDEEYREALKYSTGIDSMANMSKYDADLALLHLQSFDNMVGMTDAVAKSESVNIDPGIPNQGKIRKAAGSDEVFHKTILYSNKLGGAPSNEDAPDLAFRQKRYGQDLINVAKKQRKTGKKVAKREARGKQTNIVNPWSSARYALAEAGVKSGVPLRRSYSNMVGDAVDIVNKNATALQERLIRAGALKLGSPLTFDEGKQASEWLFTDGDVEPELKESLWQAMSPQTQKIANEINRFLQEESAQLIRWKRWLNWDDAARTADSQLEKLRDKKVKITKKRLDRIMAPVKDAKPINAPSTALQQGRDARDADQLREWLDTQKWGTRKFYYMSERELKGLTDLYPTGTIPEELEEAANLVGNAPETVLPETMTREGKGKIAKGGNLLAAVLNHANRVGVSAATHNDLQNFWEAFASTDPSPRDISSVRMLINNALGKHHVIEPWVKVARTMNNAFWRAHLGLSPKRAAWFSYRNVHQNVAYGLSQTGLLEARKSAEQLSHAVTETMGTGVYRQTPRPKFRHREDIIIGGKKPTFVNSIDKMNPWIADDYSEYWDSRISQRKQLQHQMILQKQGAIVNDFGNKAVAIIDAIGSAPVYSDEVNRLGIWPNLHQTAYRNVQQFVSGKIDGKTFWSRLDLDTLHLDQRLEMSRLMDEGRWREFVRNFAEYKTENVHFRYETALRSIAEQSPGGRATIGLMTFPRGTFEIMYQNGYKPFVQGFESGNYKQSAKGFKTITAGIIGSRVARWMLYGVTGRVAYGIFDTIGQYSPMSPGVRRITDMFDATNEAIYMSEKNDEDIPTTVDRVLNQVTYQAELFIPMCDVLIDRYEAQNNVYGVRLYSLMKKKAVQRYRDEEGKKYRPASRDTLEQLQHIFWGGAEKGKELKND